MSLGLFGSERTSRSHQILLGITTAVALVFSLAIGPSGNAAGNSDSASMSAPEQTSIVVPEAQGLNVSVEDQTSPVPETPVDAVPVTPVTPPAPPAPVVPPAPAVKPVDPPVTVKPPVQAPNGSQGNGDDNAGSSGNSDGSSSDSTNGSVSVNENAVDAPEEAPRGDVPAVDVDQLDGSQTDALSGETLVPFLAGPDGSGVAAPYLYWTVTDSSNALVGGAEFNLRFRAPNNNWQWVAVEDCITEPCTGMDRDPDPGEFLVTHTSTTRDDSTKVVENRNYGIGQKTQPPEFEWTAPSTSWVYVGNGTGSTTTKDWNGDTYGFATTKVGENPYVTWDAKDSTGNLVSGTSFTIQGPRTGSGSSVTWTNSAPVADCVLAPCAGPDLDPTPGKFKVSKIGTHVLSTGSRYRVTPLNSNSPTLRFADQSWNEMASNIGNSRTYNFGIFGLVSLPLRCEAGFVYSIAGNGQIREASSGATPKLIGSPGTAGEFNGLGMAVDGESIYSYTRTSTVATIQKFDLASGTWSPAGASATTGTQTSISSWVAGAVNLKDGSYYLGGYGTKSIGGVNHTVFHLWKYVPGASVTSYKGYVDVKNNTTGNSNGDIAFNANGDLFIVRGDGSSVTILSVGTNDVTSAAGGLIPSATSQTRDAQANVNGVAFDAAGKGYLGNGTTVNSYTMPNWTDPSLITGALSDSTDLASCSSPATISLYKYIDGARVNAGDQFGLKLTQGQQSPDAVVTQGSEIGLQDQNLGPLPVPRGTTFTISESFEGTALQSDYVSSWTCSRDGAPWTNGVGTSTQVTIPASGDSIVCEFRNSPLAANVTVRKEVKAVGQNVWTPYGGWTVGVQVQEGVGATSIPSVTTQPTNGSGLATWKVKFATKTDKADVTVSEEMVPGFAIDNAVCKVTKLGIPQPEVTFNTLSKVFADVGPGDALDCTFSNSESEKTVVVDKQWAINGNAPITHGSQPEGLTASLKINSSAQDWNVPYGPVGSADTVKVSEVAAVSETLLPKCTLGEATIGRVGSGTTSVLNGEYTLPNLVAGENAFMITNSVTCEQGLTLKKEVDNTFAGQLSPNDWALTPQAWNGGLFAQQGTADMLIFNHNVRQTVPVGSYVLTEAEKDGYLLDGLVCTGANITGGDTIVVGLGQEVVCTFTNKIAPGSVKWDKVDASNPSTKLGGSEWKLTGPAGQELPITDCASGICAGPDVDPVAGQIKLEGLAWGNYSLVETKAPAGYQLETTPITFVVGPDNADPKVLLVWDLGVIENDQQSAPTLPLTGGLGTQIFLLIGGSALTVAAGMTAWRRKKGAPQTL